MNLNKLTIAEQDFMFIFPDGFADPKMAELAEKHQVDKMTTLTQELFARQHFNHTKKILENWIKVVNRSSMVSMFEKPKFKNMINSLSQVEGELLGMALFEFLYGNQQKGFVAQLDILKQYKLAKWSIISVVPAYFFPQDEVFVKPTTAKGVIQYFELEDVHYKPTPSWNFYCQYKRYINEMKQQVNATLSPNNAAFCGFLMMSLPESKAKSLAGR